MDTIKKMTNQASKNDFADTFEEVMREEMMAMAQESMILLEQEAQLAEIVRLVGAESISATDPSTPTFQPLES